MMLKTAMSVRLLLLALLLAAGLLLPSATAQADPAWHNSVWNYRKKLTIDHTKVSDTLTDFPVLISLASDSDLAADAQNDGDDILFTDSGGADKLSHEIEKFDGNTGELVAWVKIPSLSSSTDTDIYMYYGNAGASNQENITGVWNSNYKMVQHLQETSGGANAIKDSTSNANHGTDSGTPTLGATGKIDKAISFDGIDDLIDYGSGSSLNMTDALTIELWVNRTDNTTFERFLSHSLNSADYAYELGVDFTETNKWRFRLNSDAVTLKATMLGNPGQWLYLVVSYDKDAGGTDEMKMYENGNLLDDQDYSTALTNHGNLETNRQGKTDGWCKSIIDEVRISDTARSSGWILTSYYNQSSPSSFYNLGNEEPVPSTVIGGQVHTASKIRTLAPWLILLLISPLAAGSSILIIRRYATSKGGIKEP